VPNPDLPLPSQVSVDAWLDDDGVAHGTVVWVGDVIPAQPGGPADPWILDVQDLFVFGPNGNSAVVVAVIVHSVFPDDIGTMQILTFTDNSGTGLPDEFEFAPIVAGNFTVRD
jgi:hypothetical protein